MTTNITRLNPPTLPDASVNGHSQISIVESGKLAFISGQVAWRKPYEPAPISLTEQTQLVVENAQRALEAIGASVADIVLIKLYIVNLNNERTREGLPIILQFLAGIQPSMTVIGVSGLASVDLQLEMEMVVRVP